MSARGPFDWLGDRAGRWLGRHPRMTADEYSARRAEERERRKAEPVLAARAVSNWILAAQFTTIALLVATSLAVNGPPAHRVVLAVLAMTGATALFIPLAVTAPSGDILRIFVLAGVARAGGSVKDAARTLPPLGGTSLALARVQSMPGWATFGSRSALVRGTLPATLIALVMGAPFIVLERLVRWTGSYPEHLHGSVGIGGLALGNVGYSVIAVVQAIKVRRWEHVHERLLYWHPLFMTASIPEPKGDEPLSGPVRML